MDELLLAERQPALHAVSDVPELVHDIGHPIAKRRDRFALRSLGLSNNPVLLQSFVTGVHPCARGAEPRILHGLGDVRAAPRPMSSPCL